MNKLIEFNTVSFGIPVETFKVSAYIAMEERLPVVTEFVLRLLRICNQLSINSLRDYFGFTDKEVLALTESLAKQGLIDIVEEEIKLTAYSIESFDETGDEYPRFAKVELKHQSITFDLISFTPLPTPHGPLPSDNIVKFEAKEEYVGNSIEQAKSAYRQKYPEIAFMQKELREKSHGVYSVEDIESKRRTYIPIPVSFSIDKQEQVTRSIDATFEQQAPRALVNFINEKVTDYIPRSTLSLQQSGLDEFVDIFSMQALKKYLIGKKFALSSFLEDVVVAKNINMPNGITPIIGNLYLQRNRELIIKQVEKLRKVKQHHNRILCSLAWLFPDYPFWGRGESFAVTIREIRSVLEKPNIEDDLFLFTSVDQGNEVSTTNQYRIQGLRELHFFNKHSSNAFLMGGRLELMLYPSSFAVALYHLPLSGNSGLWLPIGFISTTQQHIEIVHKLISQAMKGTGYAGKARWGTENQKNLPKTFEEACPFLNYDSVSFEKQNL